MIDPCDIVILGAGPAGANASLSAARAGARVTLLDEQTQPGGQIWRAKSAAIIKAQPTPESDAGNTLRDCLANSAVTFVGDVRVWQIERTGDIWQVYTVADGQPGKIEAKALILATGAREYVQPIPGWTTPGVIGLAGATALLKHDMTPPGAATVVAGTGPLVFFTASEIRRLGGHVAAIVTPNTRRDWLSVMPAMLSRPDLVRRGLAWIANLTLARVPVLWGHAITRVEGARAVNGVVATKLDASGAPKGKKREIAADSVCLGNGLIPAVEAAQLAGADLRYHPELGGWVPGAMTDGSTKIKGLYICGDGAGIRGAAAAEIQGKLAGMVAANQLGFDLAPDFEALKSAHARAARFGLAMTALSLQKPGDQALTTPETILCRCESLSLARITAEIAKGAESINAIKSGTRAGMGACGGKFCHTAVARMMAASQGVDPADIPPPTARPPLRPVPASVFAEGFDYDDLPISKPAPL